MARVTACMSDAAATSKPKSKVWCDGCGKRVWVSAAQKWRAARPKCMSCGCSRLVDDRPEQFKGQPEK